MKIETIPSKKSLKLFLLSLLIAVVLNIGELTRIDGTPKLIAYFIDTFIYAVLVLVVIRIVLWLKEKK